MVETSNVYILDDETPVLEEGAWVAPGAVVVGNVLCKARQLKRTLTLRALYPHQNC